MTFPNAQTSKKTSVTLWIVQGLLAAMFLFAGAMKLVMPVAALTHDAPHISGMFFRFIGVLEVLGALGLILPGLLHLRATLTPLAAAGLVIIMTGAFSVTLATGQAGSAVPVVVGVLLAVVAVGRWTALAPVHPRGR
jgi:hypothetical protein